MMNLQTEMSIFKNRHSSGCCDAILYTSLVNEDTSSGSELGHFRAQLDASFHELLAVAQQLHLHHIPNLEPVECSVQVRGVLNVVPVQGDNHVPDDESTVGAPR